VGAQALTQRSLGQVQTIDGSPGLGGDVAPTHQPIGDQVDIAELLGHVDSAPRPVVSRSKVALVLMDPAAELRVTARRP
jgi:hypothetical protein